VNTAIGLGSANPHPRGMELMQKSMASLPSIAQPEEIAKLALFLVSEDSKNINGSCVVIDNGWSII
jgi:enoyl-[acyl-carrier-protein] reductase (NADH)